MLLPYTTLVYYGPGAAAMLPGDGVGVGTVQAQPVMTKRTAVSNGGVGTSVTLRPYRGRAFNLVNGGVGTMASQPRKRVRPAMVVSVGGALTQDGVTGAVLEAQVEGTLTLKQTLRILLAHAAGNATGLEGISPVFKSAVDSSKTRIAGTYTSGTRTVSTLDGS
jgi:hypothetical protein